MAKGPGSALTYCQNTCVKKRSKETFEYLGLNTAEELSGVGCSLLRFEACTSVFELHLRSECGVETMGCPAKKASH